MEIYSSSMEKYLKNNFKKNEVVYDGHAVYTKSLLLNKNEKLLLGKIIN